MTLIMTGAISVEFVAPYFPQMGPATNDYMLAKPRWTSNKQKIANALGDKNIEFTSGELQNRKIATTYLEKNKEIYFLGQYNEYNQWDDRCILNVYSNNELISIIERTYDNGKLKSYRRISCDEEGQWKFTDRICHKKDNGETYTSGETWDYEKNEAFAQQIDPKDFDETDFLTIEYVLNNIDLKPIGYYKGRTSNERYNDETGDACMVKYNNNGDVRYLYVGKVVNGKEHDDSGKAWFVSLGESDDSHYYYYIGTFSNGNHAPVSSNWEPMTQAQINSIINPDIYNCSLQGLIDDHT